MRSEDVSIAAPERGVHERRDENGRRIRADISRGEAKARSPTGGRCDTDVARRRYDCNPPCWRRTGRDGAPPAARGMTMRPLHRSRASDPLPNRAFLDTTAPRSYHGLNSRGLAHGLRRFV